MQARYTDCERVLVRLCAILSKRLEHVPLDASDEDFFYANQHIADEYIRLLLDPECYYPLARARFVLPADHPSLIVQPPWPWLHPYS